MSNNARGAAQAAPTLAELAAEIRALMEKGDKTALSHALNVGALLIKAKAQVQRGQWEEWVKHTIKISRNTSALYMRLAANVPTSVHCKSIAEADVLLRRSSRPKPATDSKLKKPKPTPAGKRMHAAKMARAEAKRNGRSIEFWELGWQVSRLVYGLASWHVEDVPLDYDNTNTMLTVEEDLLYLYDWMDDTLAFIHSRMGENKMREQLGKLLSKTVENGCTPAEAEAAARAAQRLRQKIDRVLAAVS